MINKLTKYKIGFILVFFTVCVYIIGVRLYSYQVVMHDELYESSLRKTMRTYTQKASRGSILDTNGAKLVSNEMAFQVVFDYFLWDKERQNEVILQLCALMDKAQETYMDTLPVSGYAPFEYTTADVENKYYKKLIAFVEGKKDLKKALGSDFTAMELMKVLAERYKVTSGYSEREQRVIIGIRYDMELQGFSSYSQYVFSDNVSKKTVSQIEEGSVFFPGVSIKEVEKRSYKTDVASHLLGRVGVIYKEEYQELKEKGYPMNATIGKDGAEKAFEEYLRPIDGTLGVETNVDGDFSDVTTIKEAQPGKDVYLTIDQNMQRVAEKALADVAESIRQKAKWSTKKTGWDAAGGAAVVIKVSTGEILACASMPTYDLESFSANYNSLLEDPLKPMFNRAIMAAHPPGSIFKMVTAVAALEENIVEPYTKIRDEGVYRYYAPSYTPACWIWNEFGKTHGNINVSEAIKYSCNYFFYEVSRIMGIDTLNKYAKALGLGEKTGIELAGEVKGNLAGPESRLEKGGAKWEAGETIQAAIGQSEQQFTPIQLANYMATIVNGGTHYQPHLLKKVVSYDGKTTYLENSGVVLDKIELKAETVDAIKKGMLGATTDDGTASSVFNGYPIKIGGKTGSAQTKKGASAHGTFLSFAPYDNPEIAVCVIIEHAGSGGAVAPVVRSIYDYYFGLE